MDELERALAASGCPPAVKAERRPKRSVRQVKTERKAGATVPAQRLGDTAVRRDGPIDC